MVIGPWVMTLYVLTTGYVHTYPPEYVTAHECAMNRPAVIAQYNKTLKAQLKEGDAYLLCHPKGSHLVPGKRD